MSFLAELIVDDVQYRIIDCSYTLEQNIDRNNKPSGVPRGGQISVVIESRGNTNFFKWMIEHKQTKDGKITFYKRDAMSRLFDLKFSKAFCIKYTEHFNSNSNIPMQIHLTLSAKKLEVEGVSFVNSWAVN